MFAIQKPVWSGKHWTKVQWMLEKSLFPWLFAAIEPLDAQEHEPLMEGLPLLATPQPERVFELTVDPLVDGIWSSASQPRVAAKKKMRAVGRKN